MILLGVPTTDEKIYCLGSFLAGLRRLIDATAAPIRLVFCLSPEDRLTAEALRAFDRPYSVIPVKRVVRKIPATHVFATSWEETKYLADICRARNALREAALILGAEALFMLDSDGAVEEQAINTLAGHLAAGLAAITTMWAQRVFTAEGDPLPPEILLASPEGDLGLADVAGRSAPIPSAGHSFGAVLIGRAALEFPVEFPVQGREIAWSEDHTFFQRLRSEGTPYGVDHTVRTIHFCHPSRYPVGFDNGGGEQTLEQFCEAAR